MSLGSWHSRSQEEEAHRLCSAKSTTAYQNTPSHPKKDIMASSKELMADDLQEPCCCPEPGNVISQPGIWAACLPSLPQQMVPAMDPI